MIKNLNEDINTMIQYQKWNKRLFRIYWIAFSTYGLVAVFLYFYSRLNTSPTRYYDFPFYVALPLISILILLVVTHILYYTVVERCSPLKQACYILTVYILLCTVPMVVNYSNYMLYILYAGPIMLSVLYMDKRVINYTCITSAIVYCIARAVIVMIFGNLELYGWSIYSFFTALSLLLIGYIIARLILVRISEAVEDAKKLALEKEQLSRELARDPFTRLFNHTVFFERLDQYIVEAQQKNSVFSLIIMDVDDFKKINDNFGHDIGDIVLLKLVDIINSEMSGEDIAFRYGGEEFIVLCNRPLSYAMSLSERIRKLFGSHVFTHMKGVKVTVSMGVCEYENSFGGRREFFSAADKALYRAKKEGKDRTVAASSYCKI